MSFEDDRGDDIVTINSCIVVSGTFCTKICTDVHKLDLQLMISLQIYARELCKFNDLPRMKKLATRQVNNKCSCRQSYTIILLYYSTVSGQTAALGFDGGVRNSSYISHIHIQTSPF